MNVKVVNGFNAFVDGEGVLKGVLHDKRTSEDILHINEAGYKILVKCIKSTIFDAKKARNTASTGRLYSNVVVRGQTPN